MGSNKNPDLLGENAPEATKSFVVLMHDPDVPSVMDNVNKEGATLAADMPRITFVHWVLADIPGDSAGVGGRRTPAAHHPKGQAPRSIRRRKSWRQ